MENHANGPIGGAVSPCSGMRHAPSLFRALLSVAALICGLLVVPYLLIAGLFWAADGDWRFESTDRFRYWLFVKGSRLERLGFVEPVAGPASYSIGLQEGTFHGWSNLGYRSTAWPAAVMSAYAERCRAMGLKITTHDAAGREGDASPTEARLVCEIEPYIDAEFHAARKPAATTTSVGVRVWGSD
jgi:hypothetical protein